MKNIFKLKDYHSDKIWGYEKWSLSTHKNGLSMIEGSGKTLLEEINEEIPIIIKTIKADQALSVQVHPGDEYSKKYENDNGKTECWYILDAKENASLICGIDDGFDRQSFSNLIKEGNINESLKRINVQKGDMIYIPSGTVHAIEDGIKILEIQQSSDVTYRIYDWGRDREMHIEKSLDVIDYDMKNNPGKIENFKKLETPYFVVEKINVDGAYEDKVSVKFHVLTIVSGNGSILEEGGSKDISEMDTIYIKEGTSYRLEGNFEIIKTYIA